MKIDPQIMQQLKDAIIYLKNYKASDEHNNTMYQRGHAKGLQEGYQKGWNDGHSQGYDLGWEHCKEEIQLRGRDETN